MKNNKVRKILMGILFFTIFLIPTLVFWFFNNDSLKEMFEEWIEVGERLSNV